LSAPYSNSTIIYKQQRHYAGAVACYNEVLQIDPMAADGPVNRGNTLKEIGHVSEAIQDYIRAVTVRPTMAEGHANLASAYKDSGHVEAAIKSYKHPWRCDLIFQRQHAICCIPYIVYIVGKIVICNRMMITIFELI
jgi:tetratricopeptide (TPR) repeat protein